MHCLFPMHTTTPTPRALPASARPGFQRELAAHLLAFGGALRRRRAYADLLQVEVAQDIHADATAHQQATARLAYTAEQADCEAARLIRAALADGHVTADEIPDLRRAFRHIRHSAAADHRISECIAS